MKRKSIINIIIISLAVVVILFVFAACDGVWGKDKTSSDPEYVTLNGEQLYFTLELREEGSSFESEGGRYDHSSIDGDIICSWKIPMYGATVYEAVSKFFEDRDDSISFRLAEHRYYMFSKCVLTDGREYDLETVYISADGKYAKCANFIELLGEDNIAGTVDDLDTLVLVYKGWLS